MCLQLGDDCLRVLHGWQLRRIHVCQVVAGRDVPAWDMMDMIAMAIPSASPWYYD
jgi:hypothetical protein